MWVGWVRSASVLSWV